MHACMYNAPKQMAGDVRLRQTIDFRKQISSLVKQKAPLGPRERRGEGGGEMDGWMDGERQACLSNLCHCQPPRQGNEEGTSVRERGRRGKLQHRGEEKRREERKNERGEEIRGQKDKKERGEERK